MDDNKADESARPEETPDPNRLDLYRKLARKGYRTVPLEPETESPSVPSTNEFYTRRPTDEEMTKWSKSESHGVGILLDSTVKCISVYGDYVEIASDLEDWESDPEDGESDPEDGESDPEDGESDPEDWGSDLEDWEWTEAAPAWKDERDRDVGFAIRAAFGDRQEHAPMIRWSGGRRILFRSSDSALVGASFRRRTYKTCHRIDILGSGKCVPVPPSMDPDTGEPCNFIHSGCTPLGVRAGDLPELTADDLARLSDALERFGFRREYRAKFRPDAGMVGLEATALRRIDEWILKIRLPKRQRNPQGHWTVIVGPDLLPGARRTQGNQAITDEFTATVSPEGVTDSNGGKQAMADEVTVTVSPEGIKDSNGGEYDVYELVGAARSCTKPEAAEWLGYVTGTARTHERLKRHMQEIHLEARYNPRRRCREFRGGSFGTDWKAGNDRLFARIQSEIPGPTIGREPLMRAFDAILYDREVDPVAEYCDYLPWPDDASDGLGYLPRGVLPASCRVDYAVAVFSSFLLSIMYMAYRPGHVQTEMPILIGDRERISTLLKELCPDPQWFTDSLRFGDRGRKLSESLEGRMIAEVNGMKRLEKSSVAELRSVLETHPNHARSARSEDRPRLCALIGNEEDFKSLPDAVRRSPNFWPVEVEARMSRERIRNWVRTNRNQLLAEAKVAYLGGESPKQVLLGFVDTRDTLVRRYGEGHRPFEGKIDRYLVPRRLGCMFTMEEMFQECGIEFSKRNQTIAGDYLARNGGCRKLESGGGEGGRTPRWRMVRFGNLTIGTA